MYAVRICLCLKCLLIGLIKNRPIARQESIGRTSRQKEISGKMKGDISETQNKLDILYRGE